MTTPDDNEDHKKRPQRKSEVPFSELAKHERKPVRRRGRPPKPTRRKHVTVHLTDAELEELGTLHTQLGRYFTVTRSELVGVALSLLSGMVEQGRARNDLLAFDLEGFRSWALAHTDFSDFRNQKSPVYYVKSGRRGGEEE